MIDRRSDWARIQPDARCSLWTTRPCCSARLRPHCGVAYFTEREEGLPPPSSELITPAVANGIVVMVLTRIMDGSFGYSYPARSAESIPHQNPHSDARDEERRILKTATDRSNGAVVLCGLDALMRRGSVVNLQRAGSPVGLIRFG